MKTRKSEAKHVLWPLWRGWLRREDRREVLLLALSLVGMAGCSHPLELVGSGDIWSLKERDCILEEQQVADTACVHNLVVSDYSEAYFATPRDGWRFDHWESYCTAQEDYRCEFILPAAEINRYIGLTVPPLVAVFTPDPAPGSLSDAAIAANLHIGVAADDGMSAAERLLLQQEFTSITPENDLKWGSLSSAPGVYDFSEADATIAIAEDAGLRIRGHTLFWHRLNGPPNWLDSEIASAAYPQAHLQTLMEAHVAAVVGRYAGRIAQWDVVNEPLGLVSGDFDAAENPFYAVLGEPYLDIAFHAARVADPGAVLYLNETFTEFSAAKFDGLLDLAERLLDRGVPLDGIGLQGHFALASPDGARLQAQLERIGALGLEVELTEVDIPLPLFATEADPLRAQAIAYGRIVAACLEVPACKGVTVWGLEDSSTWLDSFVLTAGNAPNKPLLFDDSLAAKPAYYLLRGLMDAHRRTGLR